MRRDRSMTFHVHDPKGGYYKGPTGTFRDYIDPEMTTRESVGVAWKEAKRQWKLLKEDFAYYNSFRERDAIQSIVVIFLHGT